MASRAMSVDPRAERVREQMKTAALALVQERRVETVSVSDIVAGAGVSRQVFYQHFTDRDDAIATAFADAAQRALDDTDGSARDVVDRLARFVADNAVLYRNLYPGAASQRASREFRARLRPASHELVREFWSRSGGGTLEAEDALTTFLLGGFMEIFLEWAEAPTQNTPDQQVVRLLEVFDRFIRRRA